MYEVKTDEQNTILYRIKKDGTLVEQCRTVKTIDGSVLVLPKHKKDTLVFKGKCEIKLVLSGSIYIAKVTDDVKVYIKPHYQEYHRVIMCENYNRYSLANARYRQNIEVDSLQLDDKAILDNMLECVGVL